MSELPLPTAWAPPPSRPFPEERYRAALAALRKTKQSPVGLILVLSLAAFVLLQRDSSPLAIAMLVGVLLFHELGHYAGMRAFGYQDLRMFFIPFFGAAVSGKPRNVGAWKEGVVLLLGPLPGIVAAFVLACFGLQDATGAATPLYSLAVSMVSLNAFNLLPLAGLDGARLLQTVIFSRRRWLEIAFQIVAALAMGAYAVYAQSWVLGIFAYLMLMILPHRWRLLGAARRLREGGRVIPADARQMDDEVGREVFREADQVLTKNRTTKYIAATMEQLVDAAGARPPTVGASLALAFTWFIGLVLALVTLVLIAKATPFVPAGDITPQVEPSPEAPRPATPGTGLAPPAP